MANSVDAPATATRLAVKIRFCTDQIGPHRCIVRSLVLFLCPHLFCAVNLPEVGLALMHRNVIGTSSFCLHQDPLNGQSAENHEQQYQRDAPLAHTRELAEQVVGQTEFGLADVLVMVASLKVFVW